ncbi:hypothetical protein C8J56DRAFT_1075438, partial [Mycena floridula]
MRCNSASQWITGEMSSRPVWQNCQPQRAYLYRLPEREMHLEKPQPQSRVLRLWEQVSRSFEMPSRTEEVVRLLLTMQTLGSPFSSKVVSLLYTLLSLQVSAPVSLAKFQPYPRLLPLLIIPSFYLTKNSSGILFKRNLTLADTLVLFAVMISNLSSALSSRHPSLLFQSPESQGSLGLPRICLIPIIHNSESHLSTHLSSPTIFLVPGEHSMPFRSSFADCHLGLRAQLVMSKRHIELFLGTNLNGQDSLSVWTRTVSVSIHRHVLDSAPALASMELLLMLALTLCGSRELDLWPNGSTTMSSSESFANTKKSSIGVVARQHMSSPPMVVVCKPAGNHGTVEAPFPMVATTSLSKTTAFLLQTYPQSPLDPWKMPSLRTTLTTSIAFLPNSVFLGSSRKTLLLHMKSATLGLTGTFRSSWCRSPWRRGRNIQPRSQNGSHARNTHWVKSRRSLGNLCIPAWSFLPDERISLGWKPCLGSSVIVLSCRVPHLPELKGNWNGGLSDSSRSRSRDEFLELSKSLTSMPSQTPAQASGLPSSSPDGGALGDSCLTGIQMEGILAGQRQLVSSLPSTPFSDRNLQPNTSEFSVITKVLSKGGGMAAAGVNESMKSFVASIQPVRMCPGTLTPNTSQQMITLLMALPGASTQVANSSYHLSPFQAISSRLSSILTLPYPSSSSSSSIELMTAVWSAKSLHELRKPKLELVTEGTTTTPGTRSHFNAPLSKMSKPRRVGHYPAHLQLQPSILRPHCRTSERLRLWRPAPGSMSRIHRDQKMRLTDVELEQIESVMSAAWAPGTLETY